MTSGKSTSELLESSTGQFSKFSINQDRPAKRRRNTRGADPGPNPSTVSPGSSGGVNQAEKDAVKGKDGTVSVAARSCAECRRMKLKCDRIFPCKTCVRRGLEGICPEGSLVTGRGTRYVLASTQELHEKILKMADRIKTLEDALGALHQEHDNCRPCTCQSNEKRDQPAEPHPLLRNDLLLIKGQLELYGLSPPKEQSASSWEQPSQSCSQDRPTTTTPQPNGLEKEVLDLEVDQDDEATNTPESKRKHSDAVENGRTVRRVTDGKRQRHVEDSPIDRGRRLRAMLPPPEEAEHLARELVWHGAWILNITSRPANREKLLHDLYHGPLEEMRPQDVALTLAALALGERVDIGPATFGNSSGTNSVNALSSSCGDSVFSSDDEGGNSRDSEAGAKREVQGAKASPNKRDSRPAQESYNLAKAALNEVPVQSDPDQTVVHCLYLMAWYLAALADNKDAGREAMVAVELAVKIAFKIGMHLEESYTCLSAEARQERRILFWALLHLESKLRLDASCLGALGTAKITTKRPLAAIPGAIKSFPTHTEALYHDFKLAFLEECIVPTLAMVEKAPKLRLKENDYYDVLDLDGRIRDFELPAVLAEPIGAPPPPDSSEYLPVASHANLNFILNPRAAVSFNLSYGEGKAPRNVLRMIRVKAQQEKLLTLLYLHRTFFYAHIRDHRPLVQRMFLPSALAAFSAACEIIRTVKEIYAAEPELAARVSMLWYNAFLATITLFLLVVYKPFCPVSVIALQEIENSRNLFRTASKKCHMAAQSYPLLREFYTKASDVFNRWKEESEGEMNVFGPNGEVTFCQTRIDIVIQRLQCVSVPSLAEEDATTGLLSLKRCSDSPSVQHGNTCNKLPQPPCSGAKADDGSSYEMWQHAHKELTDFVRRVPEVLRDASVDPRRATAARLIWGFIPLPAEEPSSEDITLFEEPEIGVGLPSDLDWNVFADALMFAPLTRPENLGGSSMNFELPTPPVTTYSPESSQSTYSLLDLCSDFDFGTGGASGTTPEIDMDGIWTMPGHDDDLIGSPKPYGDTSLGPLRSDAMLGSLDGDHEYTLKDSADLGNGTQCSDGLEHDPISHSDPGGLDDGTLGYLWQHRIIQSPYLS